jgi:hypothetical protein
MSVIDEARGRSHELEERPRFDDQFGCDCAELGSAHDGRRLLLGDTGVRALPIISVRLRSSPFFIDRRSVRVLKSVRSDARVGPRAISSASDAS